MGNNSLAKAFAPWEAHRREIVLQDTWGHPAPKKNKRYEGRIVFAVGCFGSDNLNPTVLSCEFGDLDSSPWFFESLQDFLADDAFTEQQEGNVFEWVGVFKNYEFNGKYKIVYRSDN